MNFARVKKLNIEGIGNVVKAVCDGVVLWEASSAEVAVNPDFHIIGGSQSATSINAGRAVTFTVSTTKGIICTGAVVIDDLGRSHEITRYAFNNNNSERGINTVQIKALSEYKGQERIYTVYILDENGNRTVESSDFKVTVK